MNNNDPKMEIEITGEPDENAVGLFQRLREQEDELKDAPEKPLAQRPWFWSNKTGKVFLDE